MRARWYEPRTGRFLSEDPIGLAGGINPYAFAGSDAVNTADPTGLDGDLPLRCYWTYGKHSGENEPEYPYPHEHYEQFCGDDRAMREALLLAATNPYMAAGFGSDGNGGSVVLAPAAGGDEAGGLCRALAVMVCLYGPGKKLINGFAKGAVPEPALPARFMARNGRFAPRFQSWAGWKEWLDRGAESLFRSLGNRLFMLFMVDPYQTLCHLNHAGCQMT
jgi:hypothetical protein